MSKKYGVYICHGCGIGESLDIDKLSEKASDEGFAVKTCPAFCGKQGLEILKQEVAGGVNALVIAACSPRVLTTPSVSTAASWSGSTCASRWSGPTRAPPARTDRGAEGR
jgi:heterodisulfide reductase subunit A-like polyferredoxin